MSKKDDICLVGKIATLPIYLFFTADCFILHAIVKF
jgi:hypothetical protein